MRAARHTTSVAVFHAKRLDPGLAAAHVKTQCPACSKRGLYTLESRRTNKALRRRRKRCCHCGFRLTTYEVDGDWFKRAHQVMAVIDKLERPLPGSDTIPCLSCEHHNKQICDYGVPEHMTSEAHDCLYFSSKS